jgi:hypothetical protein
LVTGSGAAFVRPLVLERENLSAYDALVAAVTQARVSLLRWLRRQLAQPTPVREHLEAAVLNDDPREARRLLDGFEFSDAQRRHVAGLIEAWEREVGA